MRLRIANLVESRSALGADAARGRSTVLHEHSGRPVDRSTGLTLHTVGIEFLITHIRKLIIPFQLQNAFVLEIRALFCS